MVTTRDKSQVCTTQTDIDLLKKQKSKTANVTIFLPIDVIFHYLTRAQL